VKEHAKGIGTNLNRSRPARRKV